MHLEGKEKTMTMLRPMTESAFTQILQSIRSVTKTRDRLLHGLGYLAGLAAKETSNLHYEDFCNPAGELTNYLHVTSRGCSKKSARRVPVPPLLKAPLVDHITPEGISSEWLFYTIKGTP